MGNKFKVGDVVYLNGHREGSNGRHRYAYHEKDVLRMFDYEDNKMPLEVLAVFMGGRYRVGCEEEGQIFEVQESEISLMMFQQEEDEACKPSPYIETGSEEHLTDKLDKAIVKLEEAQVEYDNLLAEHKARYPFLHECDANEHLKNPENWKGGDVVRNVGCSDTWYTIGKEYTIREDERGVFIIDDGGDKMYDGVLEGGFDFVRRP